MDKSSFWKEYTEFAKVHGIRIYEPKFMGLTIDLYQFFIAVMRMGGYDKVDAEMAVDGRTSVLRFVCDEILEPDAHNLTLDDSKRIKNTYESLLLKFEIHYRRMHPAVSEFLFSEFLV